MPSGVLAGLRPYWGFQNSSQQARYALEIQVSPSFLFLLQNSLVTARFLYRERKKKHKLTFFKQRNEFWCTLLENSVSILCLHWDFFSLYQLKAFASHLLTEKEFMLKILLRHRVQLEYPDDTGIHPFAAYTLSHRAKRPFLLFSKTICFFYISVCFHSVQPDFLLCPSAPWGVNVNVFVLYYGPGLWGFFPPTIPHKLKLMGVKSIQHLESSS